MAITVRNSLIAISSCRRPCRSPMCHLGVALWQQGFKPNARCLMFNHKPVTSLKEAIDSARRHEATPLPGGYISALYQQLPHRALDCLVSNPPPSTATTVGEIDRLHGEEPSLTNPQVNVLPPSASTLLAAGRKTTPPCTVTSVVASFGRRYSHTLTADGEGKGEGKNAQEPQATYYGRRLRVGLPRCFVSSAWELQSLLLLLL